MKRKFVREIKPKLIWFAAACFIILCWPKILPAEEISFVGGQELISLSSLAVAEAFEKLKDPSYFVDSKVLEKAVQAAFSGRQPEAISFAMNALRVPRIQVVDGKRINRFADLRVAKNIFLQFQDEAIIVLVKEFHKGAPVLRCNIIQMLGAMGQQKKAREILVSALNDTAMCEDELAEGEGISMRVCDEAYNQLILRKHTKGTLRSIGPVHKVEDRNYHIGILKNNLAAQ